MVCRCTVFIGWRLSVLRSFVTGIATDPVSTDCVGEADIAFEKSTTRAGLFFDTGLKPVSVTFSGKSTTCAGLFFDTGLKPVSVTFSGKSATCVGLFFDEDLDTDADTLLNEDSDILLEELNIGSGFIKLRPADPPPLKHRKETSLPFLVY
jgi:hypothetical protein